VTVSAADGVVTLNWNDALPTRTYRLYLERGSRIVHTYVSPYTAFTNQHMTRVLDDGADPATVDLHKTDTIYNWLVSHNHFNSLERGVGASFGVKCPS
jgi:hypothetical protein